MYTPDELLKMPYAEYEMLEMIELEASRDERKAAEEMKNKSKGSK